MVWAVGRPPPLVSRVAVAREGPRGTLIDGETELAVWATPIEIVTCEGTNSRIVDRLGKVEEDLPLRQGVQRGGEVRRIVVQLRTGTGRTQQTRSDAHQVSKRENAPQHAQTLRRNALERHSTLESLAARHPVVRRAASQFFGVRSGRVGFAEQVVGDDALLDLRRALEDLGETRVAPVALDRVQRGVAARRRRSAAPRTSPARPSRRRRTSPSRLPCRSAAAGRSRRRRST